YRDMFVKAYASPHTGVVRSTQFTMTSNFFPAYPALPFGHTSTVCGIEIEANADIKIGDASQGIYQNDFTNIMVGVRSKNSIAKVENCSFSHFVPTFTEQMTIPNAGTGVVAIGSKNYNYAPMITVGGATLAERCDFVDVRNGVYAQKQIHVKVLNNSFTQIKLRGISVLNSTSKNVVIEDNFISNNAVTFPFQTGIYVVDVPYALVNIKRNRVIQTGSVNSQIGTGIHVALVSPSDATVNIQNNTTISRVKTGIYLANLTGQNKVKVSSNYIGFSKPNANYTSAHYGIRLSGCATVLCDTYTVMKSGAAPTQAMIQNLRGISIENSPSTFATDNIFVRMGSGIFGYEISSSSTLACNTLNTCYHGVFFTGTPATNYTCDIGDQLIDPNGVAAATGNTWFTNVAQQEEIEGVVSPQITWYWDNTQPTNANLVGVNLQQENYNACNLFFLQPS
ncbi:MAG: right-handed parallel beta-helix repeat-containing protein, partial [Bacteroidia bacterium]